MTTVKHFHSAMTGAPTLSGTAGALLAVLDACLVDGFNLKTASSVVVASGIATVSISLGIGAFEDDTVALIAGATPSGLNGEKRIISVTSNTFTFDATGISDQTATGTITAKLAPAGFAKAFSGTNLAAYRSSDVTGTRFYLRVDDTGTTNARVVGYESMTDVNTGTMPFPSVEQLSGGYYWPKSNAANGTARAWMVIGDGRNFWLYVNAYPSNGALSGFTCGFGDFNSRKSSDAYASMLIGTTTDLAASDVPNTQCIAHVYQDSVTNAGTAVPRSYTGLGGSILPGRRAESYVYADAYSGGSAFALYPNGPDNSLILSRLLVVETGPHVRGVIRGPMFAAQNCAASFSWRDKVTVNGRKYLAIKGAEPAWTGTSSYVTFFDITGPW
jgi:hypothetical protein